ncbi:MAG: hypothetical protein ACKVZJ_07395 [Phycisphaerales bacterium]
MKHTLSVAAAAAVAILSSDCSAAVVAWGTPRPIIGDADVSLTGTLVGAINLGAASSFGVATTTTVNGVTFDAAGRDFTAASFVTYGVFTVGATGLNNKWGGSRSDGFIPPFTALSPEYQALLGSFSGAFSTGSTEGVPLIITMNSLTPGLRYEFQVWSNLSNSAPRVTRFSDTAGFADLVSNTGALSAGVGQHVVGTFTADGTTQTISVDAPDSVGIINAIQLRLVPSPGTSALLAAGTLPLVRRRRRSVASVVA